MLCKTNQTRYSSMLLAILTLVFMIPAWNRYISITEQPDILLFGHTLRMAHWLIGPLFYLFIRHNTHIVRPSWGDAKHLTPYVLLVVLITTSTPQISFPIYLIAWSLVTSTYILMSIKCVIDAREQRSQHASHALKPILRWCLVLVAGVLLFMCVDVINAGFLIFAVQVPDFIFSSLEAIRLSLILLLVCFAQFAGLQNYNPASEFSDTTAPQPKKPEQRLSSSLAVALQLKLEQKMSDMMLFKQPELNLTGLSEQMELSSHQLSELLNSHMNVSFYDYINQLRIDSAKEILVKSPQKPIVDIAFDCGFNSKSTFYSSFKKYCGMTPRDFTVQYEPTTDIA